MTKKKKEEKKEIEPAPVKKTGNGQKNNDKKILSDLVLKSDVKYTKIVLELSRKGLYKQLTDELELRGKADLKPTITENEFNKIIGGR